MAGRRNNKSWQPAYTTEGSMDFSVCGYVQKVKEGDEVDYITFNIDNPFVKGNVNSICIEVPWDDAIPMLNEGDYVNIFGMIRSWWNPDIEKVTYSFVAQQVTKDEPKQEEKPKTRRGTFNPL